MINAQLIVSGLAEGSLFGFLGLAVSVIYKGTRTINFAVGSLAMIATYLAWHLLRATPIPYPVVILIALLFAGLMGAGTYFTIVRRLATYHHLVIGIATLGLFLALPLVAQWIFGPETYRFPPLARGTITLGGAVVSLQSVSVLVVAAIAAILLYLLFNKTKLGLAALAVAEKPDTAPLMGIRVSRVLLSYWVLSTILAALSGILLAPSIYVSPHMMDPILLEAFAAALLGGILSMPAVLAGGLILGVVNNLAGSFSAEWEPAVSLIVIVLVLMFRPNGLFVRRPEVKV